MRDLKENNYLPIALLASILVAAAFRFWVLRSDSIPFNADEAIVALMARHINQGQLPVFFYGQSYLGSLDAILVATGFRLFGEGILVIRVVQSLLFLGTVGTTGLLAWTLFKAWKAALYAGLLMAVPQVNVVLYTTVSLGGYGEMLLLGNLLLLGGYYLLHSIKRAETGLSWKIGAGIFLWGMGAGFGFWVIGLTLVYSLPMGLGLLWTLWKTGQKAGFTASASAGLAGFFVGAVPWWVYAVRSGNWTALNELAGSAIAGASTGNLLLEPLIRLVNLLVFGGTVIAGLRPPWGVRWLMLPLLPLAMIFWLAVLFYSLQLFKDGPRRLELGILAGLGAVLGLGFVFSPYGSDPSGRYFLPLAVPLAIFGAKMILDASGMKIIPELGLLLLVVVFNLGGTWQSLETYPPGMTTQFDRVTQVDHRYLGELSDFLASQEITRGYTNYWVAYPLAFLSEEELIFVPRLPYHQDFRYTARDDRYQPYTAAVQDAGRVAYITTNHPNLDNYLRGRFAENGIRWQEKQIGDYRVFYALSRPIHADQIGLGLTTTP